jgi:hypothetical protein
MERAETRDDAIRLRPLRELPALTIDRSDADVRGWTVAGRDGRPLGHVSDFLADADSLTAEYVIVTIDAEGSSATQAETAVPVAALRRLPQERRLVPDGAGMETIRLRYRSTTWLVWWALGVVLAVIVVVLAFGAWLR